MYNTQTLQSIRRQPRFNVKFNATDREIRNVTMTPQRHRYVSASVAERNIGGHHAPAGTI